MPLVLNHPLLSLLSLIISLVAIYRVRGVHGNILRKNSKFFFAVGLFLLSLAAGGLEFLYRHPRETVVLVDLSDSTRNAEYREKKFLENRVGQLMGKRAFQIVEFSSDSGATGVAEDSLKFGATGLPRLNPDQPVLLFSDGRVHIGQVELPPIYPVVDPGLINPYDSRINDISLSKTVDVGVNIFAARDPDLHVSDLPATRASRGQYTMHFPIPQSPRIVARLDSPDPWPENDTIQLLNLPGNLTQRWWLGDGAPENYQNYQFLPSDSANYLTPSVIVLNNIPADSLAPHQLDLLAQYVRDLGGSVVIFGNTNAFAAGGYTGTALETISPLSSVSPTPGRHWVILVDASGSMAEGKRYAIASRAVENIVAHLPPNDPTTLVCFSSGLTYIAKTEIPSKVPLDKLESQTPKGPTNLEIGLNQLIADLPGGGQPAELLVVSDLDAPIEKPTDLVQKLLAKNIRLHLLALSESSQGFAPMSEISKATQGKMIQETDPGKWTQAARKLQLAATTPPIVSAPTPIKTELSNFTAETPDSYQRLWLKPGAASLATSADGKDVLIAKWNYGLGTVIAASYDTKNAAMLADLVASKPRHPDYRVSWKTDSVKIECLENSKPINSLELTLRINDAKTPIPQIAPGLYQAPLPRLQSSNFAAILLGDDLLDQTLLPGKYSPEFDAVGNDDFAMSKLAEKTGGKVIGLSVNKPIAIADPVARKPLTAPLAILAGLSLAISLYFWRRI